MRYLFFLSMMVFSMSCSAPNQEVEAQEPKVISNPTNKVLLSSEIIWEKLNPARGDKSPQAGTIWGDRKGHVATGFLAKFVDGFSSPPHIHNVTYRAMVLKGLVHNDDPNADKMWMTPGSFWTQPAGESHITAAKGEESIAYVEIDSGPYLVKPTEEEFDNKEKPINVDKNNIVWLDATKTKMIEAQKGSTSPAMAFLWENKNLKGHLIRLPKGYSGEISSSGKVFHAIIIEGGMKYEMPQTKEQKELDPGSYFSSEGEAIHQITSVGVAECMIYIRTDGELMIR